MTPIFSNQLKEWVDTRFELLCSELADHLSDKFDTSDPEEFEEVVEQFALNKLTSEANIELAHVREKQKRTCGFDECRHFPSCLRGIK